MNGYELPSNSGPCGTGPCGVTQIIQGYQKLFFVDLFYSGTGAPYDLTGATQILAGFPGTGATAPVMEVLAPVTTVFIATITNLSNLLTIVSSLAGITLGMQVLGAGIPVGTIVEAVFPAQGSTPASIQLSNAATVTTAMATVNVNTGMNVSTTGDTTATSRVLSNLASVAGILVGQVITGAGIPADTTVISIGPTMVSMSAAATATAATENLAFALAPQILVVGSPGAGRLSIGVPAGDSALLQVNPSTLQNQDLQISVTNADGSTTGFMIFNVLNVVLPDYGVLP